MLYKADFDENACVRTAESLQLVKTILKPCRVVDDPTYIDAVDHMEEHLRFDTLPNEDICELFPNSGFLSS